MKPIVSLLGQSRRLWLAAAGIIAVTGAFLGTAVAVAQANLPTVAATPMDIGQCRAPTSHQRTNRVLSCSCPAQASDSNHSGGVWGTDVFTADSYICKAARHAGALGTGGGQVTLQMLPGQSSYRGSARNGETTRSYGRYGGSYRFVTLAESGATEQAATGTDQNLVVDLPGFDMSMINSSGSRGGSLGGLGGRNSGNGTVRDVARAGEGQLSTGTADNGQKAEDIGECKGATKWHDQAGKLLTCVCPRAPNERAPIWGTGTYSGDSHICKAALHAGAVDRSGGRVAIQMMPDQQSYAASKRNNVSSLSHGATRRLGSYRFVK